MKKPWRRAGQTIGLVAIVTWLAACTSLRIESTTVGGLAPAGAPFYALLEVNNDKALWAELAAKLSLPPELRDRVRQVFVCLAPNEDDLILIQGDFPAFFANLALDGQSSKPVKASTGQSVLVAANGAAITVVQEGLIAYAPRGLGTINSYLEWRAKPGQNRVGTRVPVLEPKNLFDRQIVGAALSVLVDVSAEVPNIALLALDFSPRQPGPNYQLQARFVLVTAVGERQAKSMARTLVWQALDSMELPADTANSIVETEDGTHVAIRDIAVERAEVITAVLALVQGVGNQ